MGRLKDLLFVSLILFLLLGVLPPVLAQDHLIEEKVFREALLDASLERERNLNKVGKFFSSPAAAEALERLDWLGLEKIAEGVPSLSDQELALLANQIGKVDKEIEAGALTNEQLTYVVIALATAVIVLIIVR